MKANAPEKLYITNDEKRFGDKCHSASTEKYVDDDIEYIRSDAFVEKAYEYLSYHLDTSKIDVNYKFEFIEEFRKYMKGE